MPDVLVRNVPEHTVQALKSRATRHHRSLQGELMTILQEAALPHMSREEHLRLADELRARLAATGRDFGNSTDDLREDRER